MCVQFKMAIDKWATFNQRMNYKLQVNVILCVLFGVVTTHTHTMQFICINFSVQ